MHLLWITLLFSCSASTQPPQTAQTGWQPDPKELEGSLYFLASPLLEGREAGSRGSLIAAEYIASVMLQNGLLPAGDTLAGATEWFQDFELTRGEEKVIVRNVLGMIRGSDTTKYVVIGTHYDHLGMRGETIYPGAEDNASGVSGLLALSKHWNSRGKLPPCNLIFAAWTAEEKGQLGSKYFVSHFAPGAETLLLNINLDMISRSDPQDTACNILSVGILKDDTRTREIVNRNNTAPDINLALDIWETDGNGESDYVGFASRGIPVMTFYAGANSDYHTPQDTRDKIDLTKMMKVLKLVNGCLEDFLE